jgi:hypothetical protein
MVPPREKTETVRDAGLPVTCPTLAAGCWLVAQGDNAGRQRTGRRGVGHGPTRPAPRAHQHPRARASTPFVTALHVDLATALAANGDRDEAHTHADHAARLAAQLGSARQRRRVTILLATVC